MTRSNYFKTVTDILRWISYIRLRLLILVYIIAYFVIEYLVQNMVQLYIFTVFLALSGVYFSWIMGGRRTMYYVAFFNFSIVFIFSKMFWAQKLIVTHQVFLSKSFIIMYALTFFFVFFLLRTISPADARKQEQDAAIEQEKQHRQNLEFLITSRKLKQDLIAQANMVKDELQLLEGAWRSNIHDLINDLPPTKEQEIYQQIILPFQDNIIQHLRNLEMSLSFEIEKIALEELAAFFLHKMELDEKKKFAGKLDIQYRTWLNQKSKVSVDKNKIWDIFQNIYRNSQTAIDLKRIALLKQKQKALHSYRPYIGLIFDKKGEFAMIQIIDNGGGVSDLYIDKLYKSPIPSAKRGNTKHGQGTLFVKFFADRMNIKITVENIVSDTGKGLSVTLKIPIISQN